MGLFRKGKTHIIAKFHRTDSVICSNSRDGKTPSYSQLNTITLISMPVLIRKSYCTNLGVNVGGSGVNTMLKFYIKSFYWDEQGAVRQAVLFLDRSCLT